VLGCSSIPTMDTLIKHYRDVVERYCHIYWEQLLMAIPVISTTTYCLTILCICIPPIIALIFYEREQARLRAEQPRGCRKLGLKIESNLLNEYDRKFSEGRPPSTEETSAEVRYGYFSESSFSCLLVEEESVCYSRVDVVEIEVSMDLSYQILPWCRTQPWYYHP